MARRKILLDSDVTSGLKLFDDGGFPGDQAVSCPGICQPRRSDGACFAPLRPPGAAAAEPHGGGLPPLLPPRSREAGADRGPEVPGDSSQADPADVPARHLRNVRLSANAAPCARGETEA